MKEKGAKWHCLFTIISPDIPPNIVISKLATELRLRPLVHRAKICNTYYLCPIRLLPCVDVKQGVRIQPQNNMLVGRLIVLTIGS